MPMSLDKRPEFDRLLRQEQRSRTWRHAPTLALVASALGLAAWLRFYSHSVWPSLIIGGGAILAKPMLLLMRYRERRRQRDRMDQSS